MKSFFAKLSLTFLLSCAGFTQQLAFGQQTGPVTLEMLQEMSYAKDPEAPAVYLYDIGKTTFAESAEGQLEIFFTRKTRIKIFDRDEYNLGDVAIPIYTSSSGRQEKVEIKNAVTYSLENGQVKMSPLDPQLIYTEKRSKSWTYKKFAMPNISKGSIIEFEYVLNTPFLFNLPAWRFQSHIPKVWSEYSVAIVPYFEYVTRFIGVTNFDVQEKFTDKQRQRYRGDEFYPVVYRWGLANVPAFQEEPFMTAVDDHLYQVVFQISKVAYPGQAPRNVVETLDQLAQTLLKETDIGFNLKEKVYKDELAAMMAMETEPLALAKKLYAFVNSRTEWNGGSGIFPLQKAKEISNRAVGNVADINLLLCNLLARAGLEANPVLLSTRDNGLPTFEYPVLEQFNYLIVSLTIGDQMYLLDATDPYRPFNVLPYDCLNGYGLVLDRRGGRKLSLDNNIAFQEQDMVNVVWDQETEEFVAKGVSNIRGFAAVAYRKGYAKEGEAFMKKRLGAALSSVNIVKDDVEQGIFSFSYTLPLESTQGNDKLYIPAVLVNIREENPFKRPVRNFPIDYGYRINQEYRFSIQLPVGYRVTSSPENVSVTLNNKLASYLFMVQPNEANRSVQVFQKLVISVPVLEADSYQEIKHLYEQMTTKHGEMIVVERSSK